MLAMHLHPFAPTLLDVAMSDLCHAPALSHLAHDSARLSPHEDGYTLSVNAPGVKAEDVKIEVAPGGSVSIRGETRTSSHTHFVNYAVALPKDADPETAHAEVIDGVITVVLPRKAANVEVQRVQVTAAPVGENADGASSDGDDTQQCHVLTLAAAGLAAADLTIEVKPADSLFKVSGESKRTTAKLTKCFRMPRDADDADTWHASQVDGLLTLTIPKKQATPITARRIEVSAPTPEEDCIMV